MKGADGVILIAHAGDLSRNRRLLSDEQIEALIAEGLDGLEVWHRGNLPEQRERLLGICARYHLLVTGGSDWHGKGKPNLLGENLTDEPPWPKSSDAARCRYTDSTKPPLSRRLAVSP